MKEKDRNTRVKPTRRYFSCGEVAKEIGKGESSVKRYADFLGIPLRGGRRLFTAEEIEKIKNVPRNKHDLSHKDLFLVQQVKEQTQVSGRMVGWYARKLKVLRINNRYYFSKNDISTMLSLLQRNSDLSAQGLFTTKQVSEKTGRSISYIIHYAALMNLLLRNGRYYYTQENIDEMVSSAKKKKDKTGKQAGYLTAIRDTGKKKLMRNGWYSSVWEWQCRCGNKVERALMEVRDPKYGSCGCRTIEAGKRSIKLAQQGLKMYDGVNVSALETKRLRSNNTSGVRGVSFIRRYQKYYAYIGFKGHSYGLGLYETLEEAKEARRKGEEKYFGPYIDGYREQQKKNCQKQPNENMEPDNLLCGD